MINIVADKYLYHLEKFVSEDINLTQYDPAEPLQEIPDGTHALLTRTVTKINPQTFPAFPESLSFVATGSAGLDHFDIPYLKDNGISVTNAAGCNARSVAEYVATALLLWSKQKDVTLSELSIGIIGVGHTGSETRNLLQKLGMKTVAFDPPRDEWDGSFQSASLDAALSCDILTFHVPLTSGGSHPTFHWLDEAKLANHQFKLIINASRGGVVDESAVKSHFDDEKLTDFILDVWEGEPRFTDEIARRAFIKTPHIAGYSRQAKERASRMIMKSLYEHFSLSKPKSLNHIIEAKQKPGVKKFWSLTDILTYYHPIEDYKTRFMMLIGRNDNHKADGFNDIRSNHPLRDEFTSITLPEKIFERFPVLQKLGFHS